LLDFDPNKTVLSLQVLHVCTKFSHNHIKTTTVRARTDKQTDTHPVKTLSRPFTMLTWQT